MLRSLILLLLLLPLASVRAGTLCGLVVDDVSSDPIVEAGVLVHQDDAFTGLSVATDVDGRFCLDLAPGLYRLEIRVDDYLIGWRDDVLVEDDLTDVTIPAAQPAFALGAPWPNPTSDAAKVRLTVRRAADVELSVYDTRGRLLRRWAASDLDPGELEHVWNGRDAAGRRVTDGLYLIRARTRDLTVSRPVMLVH